MSDSPEIGGIAEQMELNILDHKLRILSITKTHLPLYTHAISKVLLKCTSCSFFSFTETCDDFTIVIDAEVFKDLPKHDSLTETSSVWVPLTVSAGVHSTYNNIQGITKIAKSLIIPLADCGISVYCLSTYQTDYVLVKELELDRVIKCMSSNITILKEVNGDSFPVQRTAETSGNSNNSNSLTGNCQERPVIHRFTTLKNTFFVSSIDPDSLDRIIMGLMQNMFFSNTFNDTVEGGERFFSFSLIDNEVTIVMDEDAAARFPADTVFLNEEKWRMVKIKDPEQGLGFEECGIVAQISDPLADANISEYYISTFYSDHTLLLQHNLDEALELLNKRKK